MARLALCLPLVLTASLVALPAAAAEAAQIDGDPLVVSSADNGRLGVAFKGSRSAEFCCGGVDPQTGAVAPAAAGFNVTLLPPNAAAIVAGARPGSPPPTSPGTVTGTGSAADPFKHRTVWTFTAGARQFEIRQELTYVNGQDRFTARYDVANTGTQPLPFRASMAADLLGGGNDTGLGLFEPGPPRFVAGLNPSVGAVAGIAESTPWSHYEEGRQFEVVNRAVGDPRAGQNLRDTVDPERVDNAAAVQWDQNAAAPLQPGQVATFESVWRFIRTFSLTPETASATTGDELTLTASVLDSAGAPQSGSIVRWTVSGANTATGSARTGRDGTAAVQYVGGNPGSDTVTVFLDTNGNETRDEDEPQREAVITWTGLEAPAFAREVNVKPVSGTVLIRTPGAARRARALGDAGSGFTRLSDASQIPVGSELDTTRGRVQLTSSKGSSESDGVQSAQFYSGRFTVRQASSSKGTTELRMTGTLNCVRGKLAAAGSRSRSRRLWGNGKGRFRTRGRNSTATVRGTIWLQKDTCSKTTTTVREGTVTVKDFARRKNVRVKAGRRYVARARRR